jgi:hypothetical protein
MTTNFFRKNVSVIPTGAKRSGWIPSFRRFLAALGMTTLFLCPALPAQAQLQVCTDQGFSLVSAEPADGPTGLGAITYTWYENSTPINNSNTASLSIPAGKAAPGMYEYVRMARNTA